MSDDATYAQSRRTDRVYFSREFRQSGGGEPARFAYRVFDNNTQSELQCEGSEFVLRTSPCGRQQLKALFFVDDRGINELTIQSFDGGGTTPRRGHTLCLKGDEIRELIKTLRFIESKEFVDSEGIRLDASDLENFTLTADAARAFAAKNPRLIAEIARHQIDEFDVVSIAHRKRQLESFSKMLNDPQFFMTEKNRRGKTDEAVWQEFFEENQWIFGYGLFYSFTSSFDERKLEQAVAGPSIIASGKRVDALLRTRGIVSSLCFGEIKTPSTPLLAKEYRPDAWSMSPDLAGAIAQVHRTVQRAEETIRGRLDMTDAHGAPTGETAFMFRPRSIIVVGQLNEFVTEHGVNERKFSSFELLRRQMVSPEIITFDELYERARFIVESSDVPPSEPDPAPQSEATPSIPPNTPFDEDDIPF